MITCSLIGTRRSIVFLSLLAMNNASVLFPVTQDTKEVYLTNASQKPPTDPKLSRLIHYLNRSSKVEAAEEYGGNL